MIGGGTVHPEINFTLPTIWIDDASWSEVVLQYRKITEVIVERAVRLGLPGLVVEFEHLPPMTERPAWEPRSRASSGRFWTEDVRNTGCHRPSG